MATYSQLTRAQRQSWHERAAEAFRRFGLDQNTFVTLCDTEHILHRWAEDECNGTIERDKPTNRWVLGRPRRFAETSRGERLDLGFVPDRAAGAMRRAVRVLCNHRLLSIYWQTDPRGCQVYIYSPADVPMGTDISSCYTSIGFPCYY
jgi:hypothetical protein